MSRKELDEKKQSPVQILCANMIFSEQFIDSVINCTSKYNSVCSISYAPENLSGRPAKYPNYGDFPHTYMLRSYGKWWNESEAVQPVYMTQDIDHIISEDYVTVRFKYSVLPVSITIYETYNPGAVVRLWGRSACSTWWLLWEGPPIQCPPTSRMFAPPLRVVHDLIDEVRIEFNQSVLRYHTSLDAVLLVGYRPRSHLQANIMKMIDLPVPRRNKLIQSNDASDDCDILGKDMFSILPYEVIVHVFQYLDLRSLCRCAQVNKRWQAASIDSALYRELSLKRYWHKINNGTLKKFMAKCKGLRKLDLSWCGNDVLISEDVFVQFLEKCGRHLTHLSVGNCEFIKNLAIEAISTCQELIDLRLRSCQPNAWKFSSLACLHKLVALDLYSSSIVDEALIKIIKWNPGLKHLIVDFCEHLEKLDQVAEAVSMYTEHLVTWSSWKTDSLTFEGVCHLARCTNLRELDLGWCLILSDPRDCLAHIASRCTDLRRFIISGWRGVNDSLLLPIILSCKRLRQIDLLGIKCVTGDLCEKALACLPELELLEVSFCDTIKQEQVVVWREQYPNVVIQRSCEFAVRHYWN